VAVRVVRLGTPRGRGEGLRLGTVRRLPRGVRKTDYAKRDFFDLWLPELSPSERLVKAGLKSNMTSQGWRRFAASYRREMSQPAPQRLLSVLAALSHQADFSVGCYCEDESRCHRSLLRGLLVERGAKMA
jgi:uncharacterized protein YeaO (DUF488 family)